MQQNVYIQSNQDIRWKLDFGSRSICCIQRELEKKRIHTTYLQMSKAFMLHESYFLWVGFILHFHCSRVNLFGSSEKIYQRAGEIFKCRKCHSHLNFRQKIPFKQVYNQRPLVEKSELLARFTSK